MIEPVARLPPFEAVRVELHMLKQRMHAMGVPFDAGFFGALDAYLVALDTRLDAIEMGVAALRAEKKQ